MYIQKEDQQKIIAALVGVASFSVILIIVLGFASLVSDVARSPKEAATPLAVKVLDKLSPGHASSVKTFTSEEEFTKYVESSRTRGAMYGMGGGISPQPMLMESSSVALSKVAAGGSMAPRVSETNVQVVGIDEPDIVKTDGQTIYFSREQRFPVIYSDMMLRAMTEECISSSGESVKCAAPGGASSGQPKEETNVLSAFPPEALAKIGKIDRQGEMLLFGQTLVVFSGQQLFGYDVSDRENPKEKWMVLIANGTQLVEARSMDGHLYLVEKTVADTYGPHPCLLTPMTANGSPLSVKCTDIYHPAEMSDVDSVFTIARIDPMTGAAGQTVSFVGSANQSVVYMSPQALYVTYESQGDPAEYLLNFFLENKGLVSADTIERLKRLEGYDLGYDAKMAEFQNIIGTIGRGMTGDDRMKWENDRTNRMRDYAKGHSRELLSTGIVKVNAETLAVEAQGAVPGRMLNQFSLDEYQGNLRVATSSDGGNWLSGFGNGETTNDVYVLGANLKQTGSILDLGQGERIYSARFDGDRGYLVTFRQTDPFFVLDLSNPKVPRQAGELKIPGYSSYLHPLGKNLVLGLGREGANVKLSLFDVTVADNPMEVSKYMLDEYWSEAADNHHAFLADTDHKVFFLPGGKGGYIFSYAGGTLSLVKAVNDDSIKRALYLGDFLYVLGTDAIYVYRESDWEKVKTLGL